MIIGFDGSRAFSTNKTGTENYSYQLLGALAKIDKQNQYIIYIRSAFVNSEIIKRMKLPENFKLVEIPWPRLWTQAGLALHTFKDKLDILFIPAHTLPIIRKPGLKTVITVHDLGSEYLPYTHQLRQRLYLSFMQKNQLKGATKIIAVSKATKKDLIEEFGIYPNNIKVVYEAYNDKLFISIRGNILANSLRRYELKVREYLLFVGTVQPRKNLERLIKAFSVIARTPSLSRGTKQPINLNGLPRPFGARNDSVKLVIVGQKGWLSDDIYKLPKKLGIEDKVKFLGYVEEKDLPAIYSGAIALLFPSLFEGFGLPILEAQACGCPVLTSNISSMPEVAGKGAIYVNPNSLDDIVKGMGRLQVTRSTSSGQAGYRLQLIKKGFKNVKRFSWEKCAAQTLKVFEEVTSNKLFFLCLVTFTVLITE